MNNIYIIDIYLSVGHYEEDCFITHPISFNGTLEELKFEFKLASKKNKTLIEFNFSNLKNLQTEWFWIYDKFYPPKFYTLQDWCKENGIN